MTQITVPPLAGRARGWRRTVHGLTDARGGFAVQGDWLEPGDVVDLPTGTVVLAVDKTYTGQAAPSDYTDGGPTYAADVTLHLVTADGGLTAAWSRRFARATSALGATTRKQIIGLLAAHPPTRIPPLVIQAMRRPNREPGPCRWCGEHVPAHQGHLVGHGADVAVEHWTRCFDRPIPAEGATCALCGVEVAAGGYVPDARLYLVREHGGRWEARHIPSLACTTIPQPSATAALAAHHEALRVLADLRAEQKAADARREKRAATARARRAEQDAADRAAREAEDRRVRHLTVVARDEHTLNDKGVAPGLRVALIERASHYTDGSTVIRWLLREYAGAGPASPTGDAGDADDAVEEETVYLTVVDARAAYRRLKYTRDAPTRPGRENGSRCANCGGAGARHPRRDSSGIDGVVCARCNGEETVALSFA